ncbi:sensor histidine kinase [Glycomyces sp. NPDC021274]|uniref:sensor histidine kinase n=1 Tax=Glycomyces sp. NPDC021274 TaxID=3155120 RepID=UPI0034102A92
MFDRFSDRKGDVIVGVAATAFVVGWDLIVLALGGPWSEGLFEPLGWAVTVVACAVLFVRSRFPLTVTITTLACSILYYPSSSIDGPTLLTFIIALYTLAALGRIRAASAVTAGAFLVLLIPEVMSGFAHISLVSTILMAGWFVAIVALGEVVARHRAYRAEAENALGEARRRSVAEERLRIARELHDAVGHHLSLINVQTAAALRKLRKDPLHRTEETLQVIAETSQSSLRELRAMVGVLREPGEDSPTGPGPSLEQLPLLVDAARASGLEVELRVDGRAALPVAVDAAAYRVVQESLTNVLRHAKAQRVQIKVVTGTSTLAVAVVDDGGGDAKGAKGAGNGLTGMRERAEGLGGTFDAGPRDDGGFSVEATWPLEVDR